MNMFQNILVLLLLIFIISSCENDSTHLVDSWEIGTSTIMLDEYTQEEFDQVRKNGITYIELGAGVFRNKTDEEKEAWIRDLKQKIDKVGLEVWSVHLPFSRALDISTTNEEDRNNTIEGHKKIMALLEPLGIQKYVIHPSAEPIADEERSVRIRNSITSLKILTEEVKQYDAQLALEVLPRTCLANTADEILKIVNTVDNGLEVCFDSNHLLQETPEEFVAKVGDLITTVHISDYDGDDEKHWLPGTAGIINWNNVIKELEDIGFEGPWMYEVPRDGGKSRDTTYTTKALADNWQQLKINYLNSLEE